MSNLLFIRGNGDLCAVSVDGESDSRARTSEAIINMVCFGTFSRVEKASLAVGEDFALDLSDELECLESHIIIVLL